MRGVWKKSRRWNKFVTALLAVAVTLPAAAQEGARLAASKRRVFGAGDKFLVQHSENLEEIHTGKARALRLLRDSDTKPVRDDLLVDFESDALFSNPAHQNLVVKANVDRTTHNGMSGLAGRFSLREHKLALKLPSYVNLSGNGLTRESGDFSFACEFEPNAADGEILRRENFVSGKQYLFSIVLVNGRLAVKLSNLLIPTGNEAARVVDSTELKALDKVKQGQRNLLILTYREAAGALRLELNGREQALSTLRRDAGNNFTITFENLASAPFVLFSPFRGYADNILFSNRVLNEEDIRHFGRLTPYGDRYEQRNGKFTSGLFDMGFSQSTVARLAGETETTAENSLTLWARCLDRRFDSALPERDLRFEKLAAVTGKKCRFIQFKGIFTADNAGESSPLFRSLSIEYRENPPPDRPLKPKIASARAETLDIELMPNTELDVVKGGRYILYYGHKPHKIEGAVYFTAAPGTKIAHQVPIRLQVTNEMLARNKAWADKNPRFKHRYPVFESGIGYYFWVTACDNAWGEAQELADHESLPSEAVFVRFE
ncbi:MAG: hypothetical protein J0L53_17360 [Spirochaetes bacterium]|nr:hypothetical protein [Spirochaetota bacterium]